MKKYLIVYLCLITAISCDSLNGEKEILSEDKMVSILVDIHLTEGFVQSLSIPYDSSKKLYPVLEKEIFEKHAVTDSVYIGSLEHYLRDAEKMEYLYQRAIDSLTVIEKNLQEQ